MTGDPIYVGRVLDDGSTQLTQATYNSKGHVTTATDPLGRITQFDYADNDIDLVKTHRLGTAASPIDEVVMQAGYNDKHQPNSITDAPGQSTVLHYRDNGQPSDITNARNETVTFHYTNNYLDEIFGPVAAIQTFKSEDDVVNRANDTEYGLVAYLYTKDLSRGMRVSEQLDFGMIGLNRGLVSDPAAPFGGTKQSGLGREGAHEGMLEFLETQYISVTW